MNQSLKLNIYNQIVSKHDFLGGYRTTNNIILFIEKIWDLKEMPSTDNRFENAYDDIYQHYINNDDWDLNYLFLDRLRLTEGDEIYFRKFIELIISPEVRKTRESIQNYVSLINSFLSETTYKLFLIDYFEELPVYKLKDRGTNQVELPLNIKPNSIPVRTKKDSREYPYFVLKYNNWDDFTFKTTFNLYYYTSIINYKEIGEVKILALETKVTHTKLPPEFTNLEDDFCSAGQDENYYKRLKDNLGLDFYPFLLGMRDIAFFPKIYEIYENENGFKTSLLRFNHVEQLSRRIRFTIDNIKYEEFFKFNFTFKTPYSSNSITLDFNFVYNSNFEHRIYALIRKNGTGKTSILNSLANNIYERREDYFIPRLPIFGKVFTVSYSLFDKFKIPNSDASFNYVYCGLKKNQTEWKTEEDILTEFYESVNKIEEKGTIEDWHQILTELLPEELIESCFGINNFGDTYFKRYNFDQLNKTLSSGQSIILYIITKIISEIRYDSLILFDEPETHLHPNAISTLINTLYSITKKFQSFCVIATHSSSIIQEIPARNIFVIEKESDFFIVRKLERESLGENLTTITQDIFGNREVPKHFIETIKSLINKKMTYKEILETLETDNLPISSNIILYVKTLMKEFNEKSDLL